jgi:photosystem II stability/assembly factor-like uncharacterized protein
MKFIKKQNKTKLVLKSGISIFFIIIGLVLGYKFFIEKKADSFEFSKAEEEDWDLPSARELRKQWFKEQRAYPSGKIPKGYLKKVHSKIRPLKGRRPQLIANSEPAPLSVAGSMSPGANSASNLIDTNTLLQWQEIGPRPMKGQGSFSNFAFSGWVNAIAVHPTNQDIVYIGALHGGIWKTIDGGSSWTPLTDDMPDLRVGALAIDPLNPQTIYWGTQDNEFGIGAGVFKSTDGGFSWMSMGLDGLGDIGKIVVNNINSNIVYVMTSKGIYKSQDAGMSWISVLSFNAYFPSLAMNKSNPNILYAGVSNQGVYKTSDGGVTWILTTIPVSSGAYLVDISTSNPNIIYVSKNTDFYKSIDNGATWNKTITPTASYGLFGVDPVNPDIIYIGGIYLYKTTNGGATWQEIGRSYLHADKRSMAFGSGGTLYIGNDGGIWKITDSGNTFINLNQNLAITEFYALGLDRINPSYVYGGAQDNGTVYTPSSLTWLTLGGGDGGVPLVDYTDSHYVYYEMQFGNHVLCIRNDSNAQACGTRNNGILEQGAWITPVIMSPLDHKTLFTTTNYVYKTINQGTLWTRISPQLTTKTLTCLAADPQNPLILYTSEGGYNSKIGGGLFRTVDGGANWTNLVNAQLPDRWITKITVDLTTPSTLYLTFSGFGTGHIFKSLDRGDHWQDISGNMPDLPVNTLLVSPLSSDQLIIGTDFGVFVSFDGGLYWEKSGGIPNVVVNDLGVTSDGYVVAATFGRSMFKAPVVNLTHNRQPSIDPIANTTVIAGQTLTVSINSSDPDISDNLTLSASMADGSALNTIGASFIDHGDKTGTFSWTPILTQVRTEPYSVTFYVSDPAGLSASQTVSITVPITTGPDLYIDRLKLTRPIMLSGSTQSFIVKIKNQGEEISPSTTVRLKIDEGNNGSWDKIFVQNINSIYPDKLSGSIKWDQIWTAIPGKHKYEICTDLVDVRVENNCVSGMFFVEDVAHPAAGADLFIQSQRFSKLKLGRPLSLSTAVKNAGLAPTVPSSATLTIDTTPYPADISVYELPSQSRIKKLNWTNKWTITSGNHVYKICVNADAPSREGALANNDCLEGSFVVGGDPIMRSAVYSASLTTAVFTKDLNTTNTGTDVTLLQTFLTDELYYDGPIDGKYGAETKRAVMDFQIEFADDVLTPFGLSSPTGIFDAATRAKANELIAFDNGLGQSNLLSNGSFLEGKNYWTGWDKDLQATGADAVVAGMTTEKAGSDGIQSIKATVKTTEVKKLQHEKLYITVGKQYKFAGSIKTDSVTGLGAYMLVSWQKGAGTILREDIVGQKVTGTTTWKEYDRILTPPDGAEYIKLWIITEKGSGLAYFDDLSVTDVTDVGAVK